MPVISDTSLLVYYSNTEILFGQRTLLDKYSFIIKCKNADTTFHLPFSSQSLM